MTTRPAIRQELIRQALGGRVVATSTTSTTALTIPSIQNAFGDDNALRNVPIFVTFKNGADRRVLPQSEFTRRARTSLDRFRR